MILAVTALVAAAAVILGDVAHSVIRQNERERQWLAKTATVRATGQAATAARGAAVAEQHAA